jgi:hypothetical protein
MPKVDLREELALLDLREEIAAIEDEMGDLWMDMELEERPRFRRPLELRFRELGAERAALEQRWLYSPREEDGG